MSLTIVTEPGVYDMPLIDYIRDPVPGGSLTSSGARRILPPGCPALFRYEQDHGRPEKTAFDLGHAAHRHVLGVGPELVRIEADDWRTKTAKEQRDRAYAAGAVPLLVEDHQRVTAMAAAVREHPIASRLFAAGEPEKSLVWVDQQTSVWRRARLDWLPSVSDGRMIVPEYKTCRSADLDTVQRSIASYGYHCQEAWYLDGLSALHLAEDPAFVFVFQETTAPYVVTVVELDVIALKVGRHLNRRAIELYQRCMELDQWPGYSDEVELITLPAWVENRYLEEIR